MRSLRITKQITNRGQEQSLVSYLKDVARIPMITPEEEVELARRVHEGDEAAKEKLVRSNLRFVISVAKQYQNQGLDLADLINEGNIGLLKAADKFDETRGFKFISYAVWWIRQSIIQALNELGKQVRIPTNQLNLSSKLMRTISAFKVQNGREPSDEELSKLLGVSVQKVKDTKALQVGKPASLDAPLDEDGGSMYDIMPSGIRADSELMQDSLSKQIHTSLQTLPLREQEILRLFFGIGLFPQTLEDIGVKFNITRERVRQLKEQALERLRKNGDALRSYL